MRLGQVAAAAETYPTKSPQVTPAINYTTDVVDPHTDTATVPSSIKSAGRVMNTATATKIWTTLGLALAYFSLAAWTASQGAEFGVPGLTLKDYKSFPAAIFGTFVGTALIIPFVYVGFHFLRSVEGRTWAMRIPVAFSLDIDPATHVGKVYQASFLIAFLVFPLGAQIHFIRKFWSGCLRLPANCLDIYSPSILFTNTHQYYGVTFFPFYEPVALSIFALAAVGLLSRYLLGIFFAGK